jgi:hypothetical protein
VLDEYLFSTKGEFKIMTKVPQWKLRRLASRAIRVLDRKINEDPVFKAYEYALRPVARDFIKCYDDISKYSVTLTQEREQSKKAARKLFEVTRIWLPLLKRDVKNFNDQSYRNTTVTDDILEDGNRLFDFVTDYTDENGNQLPYSQDILEGLEPLLNSALKEITEAEQADSTYQLLSRATRENASKLQQELVAFRRTIAIFSGRNDKDYQKLRESKSHVPDTDDDPESPAAPVIEPAKPGETPVFNP